MLVKNQKVKMNWHYKNKEYYILRNYPFTNYGDEFEVKVEDLSDGTRSVVNIQCDGCGEILIGVRWVDYLKGVKDDGTYYCKKCANAGFKKFTSFYDWCYQNLSKEEADNILLRWDYELNIDKKRNILSPKNISYSSYGFNGKGYWFKCLDHPEHGSEMKRISCFVMGQNGSINCIQCNTISITHPELVKFLVNKNDSLKYTIGERKKLTVKCINCGYEKKMYLYNLIRQGFGCPKCSDGIPYPEKFIFNILEQLLNDNFKVQLSKKDFKWCENYRYDFYIDKINCIIETHGLQHYEEHINGNWNRNKSLKDIQENDKIKEQLAKENGITNYIVLDCRHSELEWIKNSIMNSKLPRLLNFKEKDINWLKCHEHACNSNIKKASDLWNSGIKSTSQIAYILKVHISTVIRYLKQGTKLEWCDYNPKEEMKNNRYHIKVNCLTTGEIFNSITIAQEKYNTYSISKVCKGKYNSSGIHPKTGEKLKWMYYSEYIKLLKEDDIID